MTGHQQLAIGLWVTAALAFSGMILTAMGQLFGIRNILGLIVIALVYRLAPIALVGYTIWAFWPK